MLLVSHQINRPNKHHILQIPINKIITITHIIQKSVHKIGPLSAATQDTHHIITKCPYATTATEEKFL